MKRRILFLALFLCSYSFLTIAQTEKNEQQGDKELLEAIQVFSKYNGLILVQDSTIKNDQGKISKIYYTLVSLPEGSGFRNSIQSAAIFDINAQVFFRDPLFENENYFKMYGNWNYKGTPGLKDFNYNEGLGISYNSQVKISKLKGNISKVGDGKYEQKNIDIIYDQNGKNLNFKEKVVSLKGKDKKNLKESETLPSGNREYKEFDKEGKTNFEYHKIVLSKSGKNISENHNTYIFSKRNNISTILKTENDASGNIISKTIYHYKNNTITGSTSYDKMQNQTDSTYYEYNNQNGFVTLKTLFKMQSGKIIPEMKWEYTYEEIQKDGVKTDIKGKYNYKQLYIRTHFEENGTPKFQDNSENSKRKYFRNGAWSEWEQPSY